MIDAIVLAGGYSSRAKSNKMAFLLEDRTILGKVIDNLYPFVNKIIVVSGYYHDEIINISKNFDKVTVIRNEDYPKGMFTSVIAGVKNIDNDFILIPGDMPFIKKETIKYVIENTNKFIGVPVFNGRKGHPIFIKKDLIEPLLNEPLSSNLKLFRDKYDVDYIEVMDQGVLEDVDTLEDYNILKDRYERRD